MQHPALILASLSFGVCFGLISYVILKKLSGLKIERRQYKVRAPLLFKLLLPLAKRLEPFLKGPQWEQAVKWSEVRLTMAGLIQTYTPEEFVALYILSAIVMMVLGFLFIAMQMTLAMLLGVVLVVYGLLFPLLWLLNQVRLRHKSIQRALPNVLDLLTLSVEAGRDFLTALRDILRNRKIDPLGEELERVFREVQLGKQRRQALRAMADRVRQADLSTVVETLAQADELGVSIGHILRILGDQMRQKRFSMAEKQANESPVKLLLPLFLFIFPAVIIVMLGPILLRTYQRFM